MKPIMQATFAVFLAVAMLADGNARAEEHEEFAEVGDNCVSSVSNDTFDGRTVSGACWDDSNDAFVGARCNNNRTDLILWIGEPLKPAEGGISVRTALDGVETDSWGWAITNIFEGEISNTFKDKALYIVRQSRKIPAIKEMLKHSRLQVRIIDGWDNIHNVDIDISAFGEAIAPVRGACGW